MKILFVTLSNIGDCILTLPVLDCIRRDFPEAWITVIVGPRPAMIFQESLSVNEVFVYDKHAGLKVKINLFKSLTKTKFDLIVDLRNSIFSWLIPAKRKNLCFRGIPASLAHMRERHLFKLSGLGIEIESVKAPAKSLVVRLQDEECISRLLKDAGISPQERLIVISPGARSLIKRWGKENFCGLCNNLPAGFKIILIGDQKDLPVSEYITTNVKVPVLDLTGKTSLLAAAALLKKASLLITNDSANLHLASYQNVPIVAIFGPTDDSKYGPWSENCRVVKKEIFCRPCMKAQCCSGTLACLQCVKVEDVLRQVNEILDVSFKALALPVGRQARAQGVGLLKDYKRILIVRTDRVGDVILSTPVIKALREAYPQSYLAMVVRPYTKLIVEGNPNLDEIIIYDKDLKEKSWVAAFRFSRALAGKKFELAVVLNPSHRSNLIPFLAGIPKRIGYDRKSGFLLTDRVKDIKSEGKKHEIEYNLDVVRVLGIEPRDKNLFIPVSTDSEIWAQEICREENILLTDRIVVINPAASDDSKMWLPERYAQVANKLAGKGWKIAILGGPADRGIAGQVIENLSCRYINLVGNNNIRQAASFLRRSSLFISSDTGPMHLAAGVGVPVIAIWGRSQPGLSPLRWKPYNQKSAVIHKDVGCRECLAHNCKKGFLCLKAITADDVLTVAENILK